MENKEILREGWSIDVASKQVTHYYKNGKSLCNLKIAEPYMNLFDNSVNYLGYTCILCSKKLKAMNEQRELWEEIEQMCMLRSDFIMHPNAIRFLSERYNISKK
jgi:predicted nuclease of restriction endonuclease-like (RecB) superfamily